jgi:hypothetical protein
VGIFKEMHETTTFESTRDYEELCRMLSEAIERGHIEQIPVPKPHPLSRFRRWFREKQTNEIYQLDPPDDKARGCWMRVDLEDLIVPNETVNSAVGQICILAQFG